jgi:TatD DNase family protein
MNLAEKQLHLTAELTALKNGQDRLAFLVDRARKLPPLPQELRVAEYLIPGCLAKLWFRPRFEDGLCFFSCDSDSLVVKAVAGLLCEFYSGHAPAEILAHNPQFLAPLGITQHLTPNRRNALSKVWERIRQFAEKHSSPSPRPSGERDGVRGSVKFYDAHNHLHDDRFGGRQNELLAACERAGVVHMVVNGACEEDWPQVLRLARETKTVLPSFGYHPWYLHERTPEWLKHLEEFLDAVPGAVGEIGLDRWKPDLPYAGQEEAFLAQLRLAAERNVPASVHCLQAWGRLHDLLRESPRPQCGFVLHSFGGPAEMIPAFARLGAYFSFPGYFLNERKSKQREAFKQVPPDRLLIETDAPDQLLPPGKNPHPLTGLDGKPLNHPANLPAIYAGLAEVLGEKVESLAARVEENFLRVFGGI